MPTKVEAWIKENDDSSVGRTWKFIGLFWIRLIKEFRLSQLRMYISLRAEPMRRNPSFIYG